MSRLSAHLFVLLVLLLCSAGPSSVQAVTFTVNDLGDAPNANPGNGIPLTAGGVITLRSAIQEIIALGVNGEVDFEPAYANMGGIAIFLNSSLPTINRQLIIKGPGRDVLTIHAVSGTFLFFQNAPGTSEIHDVSVRNATNSAIRIINSNVNLYDCRLSHNTTLGDGGALNATHGSTVGLLRCIIGPSNTGTFGGGLHIGSPTGNILFAYDTLFVGNTAINDGDGGGLYVGSGNNVFLANCTFHENVSPDRGGGFFAGSIDAAAQHQVINCTFTDNDAVWGGGIHRNATNSTFVMVNTVVAGNTASSGNGPDFYGDSGNGSVYNFVGNGKDMFGGVAHGVNGNMVGAPGAALDPMLGNLSNNGGTTFTRHPAIDSPLVNVSPVASLFITTDARGLPRHLGTGIDIGAVEAVRVNTLLDTDDGVHVGPEFTLREAMQVSIPNAPIQFEPSLFAGGAQEILLGSALPTITASRVVQGPGMDLLTLRATSGRIFHLSASSQLSVISGLSMTGATNSAILNNASALILFQCRLHDNAGITEGGAVDNDNGAILVVDMCEIGPGNRAQFGGAIDNDTGAANTLLARNTLFIGNTAVTNSGGAIYSGAGDMTSLVNCTFMDNFAAQAGGAVTKGGNGGSLVIINSTIADNEATNAGGGINIIGTTELPIIVNTVVAGNTSASGPDVFGTLLSSEYNLIGNGAGMAGTVDGVNGNQVGTAVSPLQHGLGGLAHNGGPTRTRLPQPGSLLIDRGTPTITPLHLNYGIHQDARGLGRLHGAAMDIGAVEVHPSDVALPGDINGDGVVTVADVTALGNYVTGKVPTIIGNGDINNDGAINQLDVHALAVGIANGLY